MMNLFTNPIFAGVNYSRNVGGTLTNWAAVANGGMPFASSSTGGFLAASAFDGYRHTNNSWGSDGGWSAGDVNPQNVGSMFPVPRLITEFNLFTLADAVQYNVDPLLTDTFSVYGNTAFDYQYYNGSIWIDIANVTGNNKVWWQLISAPVLVYGVRANVTTTLNGLARVVELEAKG